MEASREASLNQQQEPCNKDDTDEGNTEKNQAVRLFALKQAVFNPLNANQPVEFRELISLENQKWSS